MRRITLCRRLLCSHRRRRRRRAPGGRARGRRRQPSTDSVTVTGTAPWPPCLECRALVRRGHESATAKAAVSANAREMRQVIAAVKSAGGKKVAPRRCRSRRSYGQNSEPNGFGASNVVVATIDVDHAGALIDAAVEAGANQVNGPPVGGRSGPALSEGAEAAMADARRAPRRSPSGRALARAGDHGRESGRTPTPMYAKAQDVPTRTPVEAGVRRSRASVTVTFALG